MEIDFNWLTVLIATIAGMIVAIVWYSDWGLFAKAWEKQTNVTGKMLREAQGIKPMIILLVANFITAVTLTFAISIAAAYFNDDSAWLALAIGLVLSLGLSVTTLLQHNMFEMKSLKLTFINSGYQIALFLAISLVVGIM